MFKLFRNGNKNLTESCKKNGNLFASTQLCNKKILKSVIAGFHS